MNILQKIPQRELEQKDVLTESAIVQVMAIEQANLLYGPTPEYAIKIREGPDGRSVRYIPHGYAEHVLNRVFGGDWDWELLPMGSQLFLMQEIDGKLHVVVYGRLHIRIRNPETLEVITEITKTGIGSAVLRKKQELGDAIKAADSDAFKRAAMRVGIGLDLYWDDEIEQQGFVERTERVFRETPNDFIELIARIGNRGWKLDDLIAQLGISPDELKQRFESSPEETWAEIMAIISTA